MKLVPGGHGFGTRDDGRALIVPGALPGDRVMVTRQGQQSGVERALEWQLLEPSPDRVKPVCEVARECGGCDLMALNSSAQQLAKVGLLEDALRRIAQLDPGAIPVCLTRAGPELGYRNRLRLQIRDDGRVGFFQKGTHELIQPRRCHVAAPELDHALAVLRKLGRRSPAALAAFAFVEIRVSDSGVSLFLSLRPENLWVPVEAEALIRQLKREFQVATSAEQPGAEAERFQLTDSTYMYAAPGTFTQVNWAVNRALVARVVELALAAEISEFIDLYCGCGNFSLPLLAARIHGVGVEASRGAVQSAKLAAREQSLLGRFVVDDAVAYASRASQESRRSDLIVIDPPRAGVKQGLSAMAAIARWQICLIGCDPVTFARDLRGLLNCGFELRHLEAFDMFPQTHHLESLAWLSRVA